MALQRLTMVRENLANNLKRYRAYYGFTDATFAAFLGMPKSTYQLIKGNGTNGRCHTRKPHNDTLWLIIVHRDLPMEIKRSAKALIAYDRLVGTGRLEILTSLPTWFAPVANAA